MMEPAILVRKHGERRVVAHRADGFLALLDHRLEDELELLEAPADGGLAAAQLVARELHRLALLLDELIDDRDVRRPFAVRARAGAEIPHLAIQEEPAGDQGDADHPAGAAPALRVYGG